MAKPFHWCSAVGWRDPRRCDNPNCPSSSSHGSGLDSVSFTKQ
jgi:hypothetical protein